MLTAITNRIGDIAILIAISYIARKGTFNFRTLGFSNSSENMIFWTIVVLARITKRAQVPLSAWLPAAIAAPTPVSALVHSSTLVTAGVYLLIRFNHSIRSNSLFYITTTLGVLTALIAGSAATIEIDIKKVIALSTLSQLGIIFVAIGLKFPFVAFFHLISHAYFKAILFIAAGGLIHRFKDYQDFRKIGSSRTSRKYFASIALVANLSLCGFPFISGFYSKDLILELFINQNSIGLLIGPTIALATALTALYSIRFASTLLTRISSREALSQETDANSQLKWGPSILLVPSIAGGFWLRGLIPSSPILTIRLLNKILLLLPLSLLPLFVIPLNLYPSAKNKLSTYFIWGTTKISPNLTQPSIKLTKKWTLHSDYSWIPLISWAWASTLNNNNYLNSAVRRTFLRRVKIIPVFWALRTLFI